MIVNFGLNTFLFKTVPNTYSVFYTNTLVVSQPLRIFKLLQTTTIFFVAALYCLAPLQQPLADGFHKLEHAILNTNANHAHNLAHELDTSHSHDHQLLSFLDNLFQDDAPENEQPVKEFKLDKHTLQLYTSENTSTQMLSEKNFNYALGTYSVSLPYILPPPEGDFS